MAIHGYCCNKMIVLREHGAGTDFGFNCGEFMRTAPAPERLKVCQQLFNAERLCLEIAPYCEPFKDDLLRERSRVRDDRELTDPTASPVGSTVDAAIDAAHRVPIPGFGETLSDAHDTAASVVTAAAPYRNEIHAALDVLGFVPVLGVAADGANALIYAAEGDWPSAGLSAFAMVAGIGDGAKLTARGVTITKEAAERLGQEGLEQAFRRAKAATIAADIQRAVPPPRPRSAAGGASGAGLSSTAGGGGSGGGGPRGGGGPDDPSRRVNATPFDDAVRDAERAADRALRHSEDAANTQPHIRSPDVVGARHAAEDAAAAANRARQQHTANTPEFAEALARAEAAERRAKVAQTVAEAAAEQKTVPEASRVILELLNVEVAAGQTHRARQIVNDLARTDLGGAVLRELVRVGRPAAGPGAPAITPAMWEFLEQVARLTP